MARDHRDFWQNIVDAADCVEDVPASRWRVEDYYDPDPDAPDKTYSTRGGFVPDVAFDPLEWGLPPNQLEVTTAVQMLSLMVARDLLRDARATGSDWYDPARTGVVLGVAGPTTLSHPLAARLSTPVLKSVVRSCGLSEQDAEEIASRYVEAFPPWEENSFPGLLGNVIAGRVANRLDLGGMNMTVDAACASSLSAVHVAVNELASGRADMMITGGCDTENSIFGYMCFSKTQALSRSGRIRPFDDDADGTLVGEGIGMLALKRLADAERDGDRVYAVIRGIGASSDGRYKSIYAPRAEGQAVALRRAYDDAGCSPASIGLFEAHATGTRVGDKTELTALSELLSEASTEKRFAAIGSVKSQIGHTKGAAGAASLIKLALSLYHKTLPPTINVDRPNSAIDLADAGFYLNTSTRPWITDPRRPVRRAAASAMGFGGTNFHVVVEEADADRARIRTQHSTARAHLWHAPDPAALLDLLRSGAAPSTGPVPSGHARVGFAALDDADRLRDLAVERLTADLDAPAWTHPAGVHYRRTALPDPRIGALFAGQGSQYVDMGRTTVLNNPLVGGAFDEANAAFADGGRTLAEVVFPPASFDGETPAEREEALRRTSLAQPAIGALAAGQFRFLTALGLTCSAYAGHSFGELTALWAAGSLDDAAYFSLARARGLAMEPPQEPGFDAGTMLAVPASRETVLDLLSEHPEVALCNHNAPDQVVVGGLTAAVAAVAAECERRGIDAKPLPVAAAFHTDRVEHAVEAFREALSGVDVRAPESPVFANSAGAAYDADVEANRATLAEQLREPVEFVDVLTGMRDAGCTVFVEFGPKSVLTRLAERTLGEDVIAIATDLGPKVDGDLALKRAAVRLAVLGVPLSDINRFDADPLPRADPTGMTVTLNGRDFVPEDRKAAYEAALDGSYQVALPPRPAVPAPTPSPSPMPAASPADGLREVADRHLDLHTRYVEGQLRIADGLVDALRRSEDPATHSAVEAITEHSLAIGDAHVRVNEILSALTEIEFTRTAPAPAPAPVPEQPPVPIAAADPGAASSAPALLPSPPPEPEPVAAAPAADVLSTLINVVAEKTGYPTELVDPTMDLEADLGIDSIKRVQILGALQEAFPGLPVITPAQVGELRTLADIVEFASEAGEPVGASAPASGDVLSALVDVVAEKTGYPTELVDPTMDLEADLGIDSIKRVQILGALQEAFPGLPVITPAQVGELRTLADIVEFATAGERTAPAVREAGPTGIERLRLELVPLPAVDRAEGAYADEPVAVIDGDGDELAEELERQGWRVVKLTRPPGAGLSDWDGAAVERHFAAQLAEAGRVDLCLTVLSGSGSWHPNVRSLADTILLAKHISGRLAEVAGEGTRASFVAVTRLDGALGHEGTEDPAAALHGGVAGLVKTLRHERPEVFSRVVDLSPGAAWEQVLAEIEDADTATAEVAVDAGGSRRTPRLVAAEGDGAAGELADDDVIVVTGGARGVTAACVRALASGGRGEFILLGRTEHGAVPAWTTGVTEPELKAELIESMRADGAVPAPRDVERRFRELLARREIQETLDAVDATGARARYIAVDVTDADAVQAALADDAPRVTGLVHGAGALADALLADKTPEDVRTVLGAKLTGLRAVLDALDTAPLRHVVLFASVAGVYGNAGQADYAVANQALGRLAASWKRAAPERRVTAIDWGAWDGGMVTPDLREVFRARGVALLPLDEGAARFAEQFSAGRHDDVEVLIGQAGALAAPPEAGPGRKLLARRDLTGLGEAPIIGDHRIGEHPVLPASAALGWMIYTLERAHPGLSVIEARGFDVQRGVVFDGSEEPAYRLSAEPGERDADGRLVVTAAVLSNVDAAPQSHYRGTFVLAPSPAPAPAPSGQTGYALGEGEENGLRAYADADLFHGPLLQGVRRLLEREPRRLVAECRLPDPPLARGAYAGALHSPVLGDVVLQAAAVLGVWFMDAGCLPLAFKSWEFFEPLPGGAPFVVVVDNLRDAPMTVTVDVSVRDADGRVLQRLTDVTVVATPDMRAKFAEAVRRRGVAAETEKAR
ncbi:hypothetical protein GCM10010191_07310 [Actinomadura vinacea]|uniref:SDR family NAD(P)-dependent oxidoreductase n=2 Tax=Actinomadura vinacea TaxID=115336 RepID=A0ABN3IEB7_9ACTN